MALVFFTEKSASQVGRPGGDTPAHTLPASTPSASISQLGGLSVVSFTRGGSGAENWPKTGFSAFGA